MIFLLKGLIRLYQMFISPMLGPACRYEPSCSRYAHEAIDTHGALRGGWLAVRRLGRCRPGGAGGYDPVPTRHVASSVESRDANEGATAASPAVRRPPAVTR